MKLRDNLTGVQAVDSVPKDFIMSCTEMVVSHAILDTMPITSVLLSVLNVLRAASLIKKAPETANSAHMGFSRITVALLSAESVAEVGLAVVTLQVSASLALREGAKMSRVARPVKTAKSGFTL